MGSWLKSTHKLSKDLTQTNKHNLNKPLRETLPNLKKLKNCIKYKIFNENAKEDSRECQEVKRKDETEGQRNYGESHPTEAGRIFINVSILRKKRSEPKFLLQENEMLEERIKLLAKELTFLKDIFMAHAGSAHGITVDDMEIKGLLEEEEDLMSGSEY